MNDSTNTFFGWVLFAGVIALGLSAISSRVFHIDDPEVPGYLIVAEEAGDAASGPSLAELLASGSADAGEAVFAKCQTCHGIAQGDGMNLQGPNLYAVLGSPIGSHMPGYDYSTAFKEHGGVWDYESMDAWLKAPRRYIDGTKMAFAGLGSAEDRANMILYMREYGGGPALPEVVAAPVEDAALAGEAEGELAEPAIDTPESAEAVAQ